MGYLSCPIVWGTQVIRGYFVCALYASTDSRVVNVSDDRPNAHEHLATLAFLHFKMYHVLLSEIILLCGLMANPLALPSNTISKANFRHLHRRIVKPIPDAVLEYVIPPVKYSSAVYCDVNQIMAKSCSICKHSEFENVQMIKAGEDFMHRWFVAYDSKQNQIIITIRGTESWQNWAENIYALHYTLPNGAGVHRGWYYAAYYCLAKIRPIANDLLTQYIDAKLMFTGHSSGGGTLD